jgi:glycosyltransferase involved in cell wall biosynthesis
VRITHLNTYEASGGAAKAAARLHEGLSRLGHDSRLLVAQAELSKAGVIAFVPPKDTVSRLRRVARRFALAPAAKQIAARPAGPHFFSDDRSPLGADLLLQLPPSDVLHLHWVAGFLDYRQFFRKLPRGLRLVWTLHDMNSFTGGCHTDGGCGRYQEQCGACPQLRSTEPEDLSAYVWKRKRQAYSSIPADSIRFVTPSCWLAEEAKKSSLLRQFPISVIPHGLDLEVFRPRSRQSARELFGIPPEAKVVLFVSAWANDPLKGLGPFLEALHGLAHIPELCVFVVGRGAERETLGMRGVVLGSVRDDLLLSQVYSAADIFAAPSMQDNFPNTALEALACGVPLVAFAVGGLREIVRDGETGILVPPGDVAALRAALAQLLQSPQLRVRMAENSRRIAVEQYSVEIQAHRYVELYESQARSNGSSGARLQAEDGVLLASTR